MTNRVFIGNLDGTVGAYVSRPGSDVLSPSGSRLLDTRFENLAIHAAGRKKMSRYFYGGTDSFTFWWGEVSFASLGYAPLFYAFFYFRAGSWGVEAGNSYYPGFSRAYNSIDQTHWLNSGIWLENNTTLRAKIHCSTDLDVSMYFSYIIFKNRSG